MATQAVRVPNTQFAQCPMLTGGLRYLARQPIMDLRGRVHGYELLFRAGPEAFFRGDGDMATRTMLDNTVIFGLEKLTGGLPAFVNCTSESLIEEMVHVLPSSMTVLEILENLEPTPSLIAACRKLKASGFRLALDDFTWKPDFDPLVELADYIKVDFAADRRRRSGRTCSSGCAASRWRWWRRRSRRRRSTSRPARKASRSFRATISAARCCSRTARFPPTGSPTSRFCKQLRQRRDRPAQVDQAAEARRLAHLPAAAAGQLADVRHAPGGALHPGGAAGRGRGDIPPHRHAGHRQRTELRPAGGDSAHGLCARAILRTGRRAVRC